MMLGFVLGFFAAQACVPCFNAVRRYVWLRIWIERIGKNTTREIIRAHVRKHVVEEMPIADAEVFAASLRNLLDIFDSVHGTYSSRLQLRLDRLRTKWQNTGAPMTPPPGGRATRVRHDSSDVS